jgi:hypothetical protein
MGENFKVRLVSKGYSQRKMVDYEQIFFSVFRRTSIEVVFVTPPIKANK